MSKVGFPRKKPVPPPAEIKPEPVALQAPLKVPPPEGKPVWVVVVAILVIGLIGGVVWISFASGARTFSGGFAFFPILMVIGVLAMLFGGRFGGGSQQMSRGKMDALRARFMQYLDELREQVGRAADRMDANYRWYHPPVDTLEAALGGPRMWERDPAGRDEWFGVARVGVGMTSLTEASAVNFAEPQDMPVPIEMEPATGKALQEFVRYQSVAYGTPALISLLVEPGYRLDGDRERVLALMRAIVLQLTFAHGPDHLQIMVITDDVGAWDWVKWLPHVGDARFEDANGPVRMVYRSVAAFTEAHQEAVIKGRGAFSPRHAAKKDAVEPIPHTVIISDIDDTGWYAVAGHTGVAGVTFFDLRGGVPACQGGARLLRVSDEGVIKAVPRDAMTWAAYEEEGLAFFAVADQVSAVDAERFAQTMTRWRLAEAYEDTDDDRATLYNRPRDILSYYGIEDAANIDFDALWGPRSDINSDERLRIPYGNRADTGELMVLDMKDMNDGGDGPHGVMSGTTGSGKTTFLRTVNLAMMLGHPPQNLQMVLADCKGGSGVKPFEGCPHVANVITDLESDQGGLIDRFIDALWGEIARRKQVCSDAGADDAKEYNIIRAEKEREGIYLPPLPTLIVEIDEFKEFFRLKSEAQEALDQVCRQGRSYWVYLLMASQDIDTRAEKLLENVGYRLVLRANTPASAAAAGVPAAVSLPKEVGLGYFRGSANDTVKFRAESLWRDYRRPGANVDEVVDVASLGSDYLEPQLFTTDFAPLPVTREPQVATDGETDSKVDVDSAGDDDEADALRKPKVGLVIRDQLRQINFEPYRLWRPPLDTPRSIDDLVEMHLGRPWDQEYASGANLVFPVGLIDRPYKHDQQPLVVDAAGEGTNVLVIGDVGSGKTSTLQTLICSAAMTHTPEQVQFYCLALSGAALGTVAGLPHVGGVAYALDDDGIRRTVAEIVELLRSRMRSFAACGITSLEDFRRRKFGGAPGDVPDDPYGDVFLVIDNYGALTDDTSSLRGKEALQAQINKLITDGRSYGIHAMASVNKNSNLHPSVRDAWPQRIELRLAAEADSRSGLKLRELQKVPKRAGRGMVMQNYPRQGVDPVGLHTLMARPALRSTDSSVFDSASVVAAVQQVAAGYRRAPEVRRLPTRVDLAQVEALAAQRGARGLAYAVDEFADPVTFDAAGSPFLVITGRARCGRTTAAAALMTQIACHYAPGSSHAGKAAGDERVPAQVWVISPDRKLLRVLGEDYVQRFAYRADGVRTMAAELAAVLHQRQPEAEDALAVAASMTRSWSGPEIFLIIDDAAKLPAGLDSPLAPLAEAVKSAEDVGLRVIYTRTFGGFSGAGRADPLIQAMLLANAPLLVMDSDQDEGFVRGKWRGHDMPVGRGFLMSSAESGKYVQVGWVSVDQTSG